MGRVLTIEDLDPDTFRYVPNGHVLTEDRSDDVSGDGAGELGTILVRAAVRVVYAIEPSP